MNKARRDKLFEFRDQITAIRDQIEELKDEEQAAFDNMPESFQTGQRGEAMETNISTLDDICDKLEEVDQDISTVMEG